jgi:TolB protein
VLPLIQLLSASLIPPGMRLAVESTAGSADPLSNNVFITGPSGFFQLTSGGRDAQDAAWSPDGTRIAFRGFRTNNDDIFVINVDGTGLTQLTNVPVHEGYPAWSPLGDAIAFGREDPTVPEVNVWIMNPDGSNQRQLSSEDLLGNISWSPDGSRVIWGCPDTGLVEINSDGTNERFVTTIVGDLNPHYSPDGTQIVFDFNPSVLTTRTADIWIVNPDGTNRRQITSHPSKERLPRWGPGPNQITFSSDRTGTLQTYIMNADGTGLQQVTTSATGEVDQPIWWPR